MFLFGLIVFIFLISIYLAFALAILYHLKKYRWPGDLNLKAGVIFVIGSLFLIFLATFFLFSLPH